jgi:hypothetical protein
MHTRGFLLAVALVSVDAVVCHSPLNKRFETPCATTVATKGPVEVRRLGTEQAVTLVITSDLDPGFSLEQTLDFGALLILKYFTNSPGGQAPGSPGVVLNRTAPLTIRKDAGGAGWTLWMAASPNQFPDGPSQLPKPGQYEELSALPLPAGGGEAK